MANLQFSDLQNECYAHLGLDSTDTTNQTNVNRWINYVQQDFCSRWPWPFMESRESIVTVPDYTAGTISINSGSNTVTGSSTVFTSTMANGQYFIQFSGSNDWYKITAFNSATSLTVEQNYQGTTNLTNSSYILRKIFYSMSSSADEMIDARNWQTPLKLIQVDPRQIDDLRPNPQDTNSSYGYLMWGYDSSGNLQLTPYPFPSDARLIELRTKKRPVDMVNSTDVPSVPNKYSQVIAWGATSIGFMFLRKKDLAELWGGMYEKRINEIKKEFRMSEDNQPILRSIDSVQRAKWISLPEQYPVITSG